MDCHNICLLCNWSPIQGIAYILLELKFPLTLEGESQIFIFSLQEDTFFEYSSVFCTTFIRAVYVVDIIALV